MLLAWIDPRPFIGIGLIPISVLTGFLLWRFLFRRSSWVLCQIAAFSAILALYQFVLFGPFIDQKRVVPVEAVVTFRPDLGPNAVAFAFPDDFGFGGLISGDIDVANHLKEKRSDEATVSVELTYDFGQVRGMSLIFAYADGILFLPDAN